MAIITNLSPPAGSPIGVNQAISFDVIDPVIEELRIFVWAVYPATGQAELVYDADNFQALFSFAQITSIPGGRRFTVQRVGGWPNTPELRVDTCACPPDLSGGEANTGNNVGGGAGVFQTKSGVQLLFRSLVSGDASVNITQNANEIDLQVAPGAAENLSITLAAGNNTGASDIEVAAGQVVRGVDDAGGVGGDLDLTGGDHTGAGPFAGGAARVTGGTSAGAGVAGGVVVVTGGVGDDGDGGGATLSGGQGTTGRTGGGATIRSGASASGSSGDVTIETQAGTDTGDSGDVIIRTLDSGAGATGDAGDIQLVGGSAASTNGDGGSISLVPGSGAGAGAAGTLLLDYATWPAVDATGVLTSDGAGNLSWGAGGSSGPPHVSAGVPLETESAATLVAYVDAGDPLSYPGTGTAVTDLVGNLTNGTINGNTAYRDGAWDFDQVSGNVAFDKPAAVDDIFNGGGTIQVFARPRTDGESSNGRLVSTGVWELFVENQLSADGGSVRVSFRHEFSGNDGTWDLLGEENDVTFRSLRLGSWQSIAVEYDSSDVANVPTFYVNGRPFRASLVQVTGTPTGTAESDVGNQLLLGNRAADDRTYHGQIDVFLAWDGLAGSRPISVAHTVFGTRHGLIKGTSGTTDGRQGASVYIEGGDATGPTGANSAGHVFVRGGDCFTNQNSPEAGRVEIRGGNSDINDAGPLGVAIMTGGRGPSDANTRTVGFLGSIGSEFGGGTISSGGNTPSRTLFRGTDHEGAGAGGDAIFRAGDCFAGSGNDSGGDVALVSGRGRNGFGGGSVLVRSAGPTGTASTTGDILVTTQQTNDTALGYGAQGGVNTDTGDITITTGPVGSSANSAGDIVIEAGSTNAVTGNDPGAVTITAGDMDSATQGFVPGRAVRLNAGNNAGAGTSSTGGRIELNPGTGGPSSDDGFVDVLRGGIRLAERADHTATPAPGLGELWHRSSDNAIVWTDPAGVDYDLTVTGGGIANGTVTDAMLRWDGAAWVEEPQALLDASGNLSIEGDFELGTDLTADCFIFLRSDDNGSSESRVSYGHGGARTWDLEKDGTGQFVVRRRNENTGVAVDDVIVIPAGSAGAGTPIQQIATTFSGNVVAQTHVEVEDVANPATPPTNHNRVFSSNSDGRLKTIDSDGDVKQLGLMPPVVFHAAADGALIGTASVSAAQTLMDAVEMANNGAGTRLTGWLPETYSGKGLVVRCLISTDSEDAGFTVTLDAQFDRVVLGTSQADTRNYGGQQSGSQVVPASNDETLYEITINFSDAQIDGLQAGEHFVLEVTADSPSQQVFLFTVTVEEQA